MKKQFAIFCISLLIFQHLAIGAIRNWDGGHATSPNWSEATNWSDNTAPVAGDTATFDGVNDDSCFVDVNFKVNKVIIAAGYSGGMNAAGRADTALYGYIDHGNGKRNSYGTSLCVGDSFLQSAAIPANPATPTLLVINSNLVIDSLKSGVLLTLKFTANGQKVTATNTGTMAAKAIDAPAITALNNDSLITNGPIVAARSSSGKVLSAGTGFVFGGSSSITFDTWEAYSNIKDTVDAFSYAGISSITFRHRSPGSSGTYLNGNIDLGTKQLVITTLTSAVPSTFSSGSYRIKCGALSVGNAVSGAKLTVDLGSGIDTITSFSSVATNTDTTFLNMGTSQVYNSGDWKCGSLTKVTSGTSKIIANGTGTQVFKCTQLYYDMDINKSAGRFVDSGGVQLAGDLTVINLDTLKHIASPTFGGDVYYNDNTVITYGGAAINHSGYTLQYAGNGGSVDFGTSTINKTGAGEIILGANPTYTTAGLSLNIDANTLWYYQKTSSYPVIAGLTIASGDTMKIRGVDVSSRNIECTSFSGAANSRFASYDANKVYLLVDPANAAALVTSGVIDADVQIYPSASPFTTPAIRVNAGNLMLSSYQQATKYALGGRIKCDSALSVAPTVYPCSLDCGAYACTSATFMWSNGTNYNAYVNLGSAPHYANRVMTYLFNGTNDSVIVDGGTATISGITEIDFQDTLNGSYVNHFRGIWGADAIWYLHPTADVLIRGRGFDLPYINAANCAGQINFQSAYNGGNIYRLVATSANVRLPAAKKMTVQNYTSGDWDGADGSLTSFATTSAGAQCTLDIPNPITVQYVSARDMYNVSGDTVYADDGTSINYGNNVRWIMGAVVATTKAIKGEFDSFARSAYRLQVWARNTFRLRDWK